MRASDDRGQARVIEDMRQFTFTGLRIKWNNRNAIRQRRVEPDYGRQLWSGPKRQRLLAPQFTCQKRASSRS